MTACLVLAKKGKKHVKGLKERVFNQINIELLSHVAVHCLVHHSTVKHDGELGDV